MPLCRTGPAVDVHRDAIYVMGGNLPYDGVGYPVPPNVDIYDPLTDSWSVGPPLSTGRTLLGAASVNNTIYIIVGFAWPAAAGAPINLLMSPESLTVNQPPTIGGADVYVTQNSTATVQVATVDDAEDGASAITVTVTSSNPSNGVTISNIVNSGGVITADITGSSTVGPTSFTLKATDPAGAESTATLGINVTFVFNGFLQPVDNLPALNVAVASSSIPVKFSLSGDQGLAIFAAGYPGSGPVACNTNEPGADIEETVTAGGSSLSYDGSADRYSYVWKTNKAWKGTCRILVVRLIDGTDHFAKFRFKSRPQSGS